MIGEAPAVKPRQVFCQAASRKRRLLSSYSKYFFGGFVCDQGITGPQFDISADFLDQQIYSTQSDPFMQFHNV
jgi:hypothetical protein